LQKLWWEVEEGATSRLMWLLRVVVELDGLLHRRMRLGFELQLVDEPCDDAGALMK
jgi:hypothetical protein